MISIPFWWFITIQDWMVFFSGALFMEIKKELSSVIFIRGSTRYFGGAQPRRGIHETFGYIFPFESFLEHYDWNTYSFCLFLRPYDWNIYSLLCFLDHMTGISIPFSVFLRPYDWNIYSLFCVSQTIWLEYLSPFMFLRPYDWNILFPFLCFLDHMTGISRSPGSFHWNRTIIWSFELDWIEHDVSLDFMMTL